MKCHRWIISLKYIFISTTHTHFHLRRRGLLCCMYAVAAWLYKFFPSLSLKQRNSVCICREEESEVIRVSLIFSDDHSTEKTREEKREGLLLFFFFFFFFIYLVFDLSPSGWGFSPSHPKDQKVRFKWDNINVKGYLYRARWSIVVVVVLVVVSDV